MAYFRATASNSAWDNINTWSTWSGAVWSPAGGAGRIPTAGDDVFLNGFNVLAISNATMSCTSLQNTNIGAAPFSQATTTATTGQLSGSQGSVTYQISASDQIRIGTVACFSFPASSTVIFNTPHFNGSYSSTAIDGVILPAAQTTCNYTFTGDVSTQVTTNSANSIIQTATSTNITILGNLYGLGRFIWTMTNMTLSVNGNVSSSIAGTGTSGFIAGNTGTNATVRIGGNASLSGAGNLINTGVASMAVIITGSVSTTSGTVINNTVASPITILGNVTASPTNPAILSTSTALVTVYGNLTNNGIYQAVSAQRLAISSSANITLRTTDGNDTDFTPQVGGSPNYPAVTDVRNTATVNGAPGQVVIPSANDVRFGIPFDTGSTGLMVVPSSFDVRLGVPVNTASISGQQATGSMVVPLASQVKQGVSVNTGSATGSYIGPADIWSYPTASLTAGVGKLIKDNLDVNVGSVSSSVMFELNKSGSQYAVVTRLQNASTVGTTGDQISSFNT
jgi:hypothetical protein